jgi:prepilin-type N-terminal cleavage/methylation domain-containing protein
MKAEQQLPMQAMFDNKKGFTVVELVIAVTITAIVMSLLFGAMHEYYTSNVTSVAQTNQNTDTRSVLRTISDDLDSMISFQPNQIVTAIPLGSDNLVAPWTYTGASGTPSSYKVLIATTYATDKLSSDATRTPIFVNTGSGCSPDNASLMRNTLIYFVARDASTSKYNLYKRTLVNTGGGSPCSTPFQKNSCKASLAAASPLVCGGSDALILSDIKEFNIAYYLSNNQTSIAPTEDAYNTGNSLAVREDIVRNAKTIEITAVTNRLINGKSTDSTATVRISKPY